MRYVFMVSSFNAAVVWMTYCRIGRRDAFGAGSESIVNLSSTMEEPMSASIQPAELGFFSTLAAAGSLSAAAREWA